MFNLIRLLLSLPFGVAVGAYLSKSHYQVAIEAVVLTIINLILLGFIERAVVREQKG